MVCKQNEHWQPVWRVYNCQWRKEQIPPSPVYWQNLLIKEYIILGWRIVQRTHFSSQTALTATMVILTYLQCICLVAVQWGTFSQQVPYHTLRHGLTLTWSTPSLLVACITSLLDISLPNKLIILTQKLVWPSTQFLNHICHPSEEIALLLLQDCLDYGRAHCLLVLIVSPYNTGADHHEYTKPPMTTIPEQWMWYTVNDNLLFSAYFTYYFTCNKLWFNTQVLYLISCHVFILFCTNYAL